MTKIFSLVNPSIFFGFSLLMGVFLTLSHLSAQALTSQEIEAIKEKVKSMPDPEVKKGEQFILKTNFGDITIELLPEIAPRHCANFKKLALAKFYEKTKFHRFIPGFILQGGDILTRDLDPSNDGTGSPGYQVKAEFNDTKHVRGIISMARARHPDSAGSQFFIVLGDIPSLDGKYTVFAKIVDGYPVLDKIAEVPVTFAFSREKSLPRKDIILLDVIPKK